MLSHITTDLHQVYLEEVFTPQLGKPGASTPTKPVKIPSRPSRPGSAVFRYALQGKKE